MRLVTKKGVASGGKSCHTGMERDQQGKRGAVRPAGINEAIGRTDDWDKHCSLLRKRADVCGLQILEDKAGLSPGSGLNRHRVAR